MFLTAKVVGYSMSFIDWMMRVEWARELEWEEKKSEWESKKRVRSLTSLSVRPFHHFVYRTRW